MKETNMFNITLLQIPPEVQVGQVWAGYDAYPNFHRRTVIVLDIYDDSVKIVFSDMVKSISDDKYFEYPKTMFSNILTGFCYKRTINGD